MAETPLSVRNPPPNDDGGLNDPLMLKATTSPSIEVYNQVSTPASSQEVKSKDALKFFSIKKELVPLKIVLFCWFGAYSSLIPFMTIYFKSQGITANETAFIYSFFPVAKLVGPTLGGLVADKIGRYKLVLYVSLVLTIVFASSFLLIPAIPKCKKIAEVQCWKENVHGITARLCCPKTFCEDSHNHTEVKIQVCSLECKHTRRNHTQTESKCIKMEGNSLCVNHSEISIDNTNLNSRQIFHFCSNNETSTNSSEAKCFSIHEKDCNKRCQLTHFDKAGRCERNWDERLPTLALVFFVFMGFHTFVAISFSLIETTALALVKKHKDDYGRQRFWSSLSMAIFSPLSGVLVDVASGNQGYADYSPVFYSFDVLILLNIVVLYILDLPVTPLAKQIKKNVIQLLKSSDVIIFLLVVFFLGTFMGFFRSFLFWHLLDLGSPKYLLGIVVTIGCLSSLPFLYVSNWIVKRCGRTNLLISAFLFYFIRLFGYSYIYNPWWIFLFEAMDIFTVHLMWVAAATYAASVAPKGLLATVQGSVAGIHFGIGTGSGTLIGGNLISAFGNRIAFRSMGFAAGLIGMAYALLNWLHLRCKESRRQEVNNTDAEGRLQAASEEPK